MSPDFDKTLDDALLRGNDPANADFQETKVDPVFANPHTTASGKLAAGVSLPADPGKTKWRGEVVDGLND